MKMIKTLPGILLATLIMVPQIKSETWFNNWFYKSGAKKKAVEAVIEKVNRAIAENNPALIDDIWAPLERATRGLDSSKEALAQMDVLGYKTAFGQVGNPDARNTAIAIEKLLRKKVGLGNLERHKINMRIEKLQKLFIESLESIFKTKKKIETAIILCQTAIVLQDTGMIIEIHESFSEDPYLKRGKIPDHNWYEATMALHNIWDFLSRKQSKCARNEDTTELDKKIQSQKEKFIKALEPLLK